MENRNFAKLSSLEDLELYDVTSDFSLENSGDEEESSETSVHDQAVDEVRTAEQFIHKEYLGDLRSAGVKKLTDTEKTFQSIRLYRVKKIIYDCEEDPADKLLSVYNALLRFSQNIILLVKGDKTGVELYIGVRSVQNTAVAGDILKSACIANFPGSVLLPVDSEQTEQILSCNSPEKSVAILSTVPAERNKEKNNAVFAQGLEKFIDTMRGHSYLCQLIVSPIPDKELSNRKQGLEELYSALFPYSRRTMSHGHNDGVSITNGITESISNSISRGISLSTGSSQTNTEGTSEGSNIGASMIVSFGFNRGRNESYSDTKDKSRTTDEHTDESKSKSVQHTSGTTKSVTDNLTIELKNKSVDMMLEVLGKHIERIEDGFSYGMWECAAYFIAPTVTECAMAAGSFKSLMAGDDSGIERSYTNYFDPALPTTAVILESLQYGLHPQFEIDNYLQKGESICIRPASLVTGKELPLFMGLPRKSVNGVTVMKMAAFGRNISTNVGMSERQIRIGNVHFMNYDDEKVPAVLDAESLTAHCFITGSTGSGKSNTVYRLLDCLNALEKKVSFLVIEPAKGEYRREFGGMKDINIFTTNPFEEQLLKLNPFYFNPGIHILEHLDRLVEIFNACWEMYAAMPAILKDALERAYINKGWDMINSLPRNPAAPEYPTFVDLLEQLPCVINESSYSADAKGDYKGALITRVQSLTNGIYGQIFCDTVEIDEQTLFDSNTIVDLSRVGSSETKSLLMGILVLKLSEYRMATAKGVNQSLHHVTVLEEAHNLLKNTRNMQSAPGSTIVAKSVEMITSCIAEMRTYGEGFIIVDQSPTSVDISAIKNTNTKIVMRLPDKEDCEIAGNSLALEEEQTAELPRLETGVAVVMQNNWAEAVLCKIDKAEHDIPDRTGKVDVAQLMQFRSMVANGVVDAFIHETGYRENRILEQIDLFDINIAKKKEMKRYITTLAHRLQNTRDVVVKQKAIGSSLIKILGFEDAFRMAEKEIRWTEDKTYAQESVEKWQDVLIDHLCRQVEGEARNRKRMFQYMLFAQDSESKRIDYGYLYRKIYAR